jgi:hypothetical protein
MMTGPALSLTESFARGSRLRLSKTYVPALTDDVAFSQLGAHELLDVGLENVGRHASNQSQRCDEGPTPVSAIPSRTPAFRSDDVLLAQSAVARFKNAAFDFVIEGVVPA